MALGKFYYSAFRELELDTKLRSQFHLRIKYFVLADVLLKADLWMGKTVVSVYFENQKYREGKAGRKQRPQYFLEPGFCFLDVTIHRQGFGNFWRVSDEDVTALAQKLQAV